MLAGEQRSYVKYHIVVVDLHCRGGAVLTSVHEGAAGVSFDVQQKTVRRRSWSACVSLVSVDQ